MKYPITLLFALPILLLVSSLIEGDGRSVMVTITVLGLMFLTEIKFKYGDVTLDTAKMFFNTPIKPKSVFRESPLDNSPKVSMLAGIFIILGGTLTIVCVLVLYFSFTQ